MWFFRENTYSEISIILFKSFVGLNHIFTIRFTCNNKGVHRNWKLDSDCHFSTNILMLHVSYSREMTLKEDVLVQVLLLQVETIHVLKLYCLKLYISAFQFVVK